MTTPQLLQQAKQGDPDAIAQLMNQSLEAKGIKATVSRGGDRLRVLLNSENELNQSLLTQFIHKGIQNLNIPSINVVEVVGQSKAASPWNQTLHLQGAPADTSPPPAMPEPSSTPVAPEATAPLDAPAPSIAQEELDFSAAALDDDFSLDDELSLAEIDQIVADAVKEVTTKIQSEIPFDPSADEESAAALYGPPGTYTSTPLSEAELPMDEAIRQAVQANDLDTFIDQELALPDAVTTLEQEEMPLSSGTDTIPYEDTADLETDNDSPPSNYPDDEGDTPMANRESSDADGAIAPPSSSNDSSASKVLLTIVSLLTFGAIAGVIGYSLRDYTLKGGNVWAFPPTLPASSENGTNDGTSANPNAGASEDAVPDNTANNGAASENGATSENGAAETAGPDNSEGEVASDNGADSGSETAATTDADSGAETVDAEATASDDTTPDETTPDEATTTSEDTSSDAVATGRPPATAQTLDAAIASVSCPVVLGGSDVTITQIEINPDVAIAGNTYPLVGCLTNHTEEPIISAVLKYQGQPTEAAADIVPQDEWSLSSANEGIGQLTFAELPPKSTAVFIAELPVAEGTTSIDLKSLAWRPAGWAGDAKQMNLGFSMGLTQ